MVRYNNILKNIFGTNMFICAFSATFSRLGDISHKLMVASLADRGAPVLGNYITEPAEVRL